MAARPVAALGRRPPPVVDLAGARGGVGPASRWAHDHPFPTCFGCGPRARPRRRAVPLHRAGRRRPLRGAVDAARPGRATGRRRRRCSRGRRWTARAPRRRTGTIARRSCSAGSPSRWTAADRGRRAARDPVLAGGGRRPQAPHRGVRCTTARATVARPRGRVELDRRCGDERRSRRTTGDDPSRGLVRR